LQIEGLGWLDFPCLGKAVMGALVGQVRRLAGEWCAAFGRRRCPAILFVPSRRQANPFGRLASSILLDVDASGALGVIGRDAVPGIRSQVFLQP
jgi:hypothetical protein